MFKEENFNKIIREEESIASSEITPKNRNENQIRLATELFEHLTHTKVNFENKDERNSVMEYWTEAGYSKLYRELEKDPIFLKHPRLQGDIFKLTFEDILTYKSENNLPE